MSPLQQCTNTSDNKPKKQISAIDRLPCDPAEVLKLTSLTYFDLSVKVKK